MVLGDAENLHRSEHLLVSVSEDELLLFGGEQDGQLLDDIYLINEKVGGSRVQVMLIGRTHRVIHLHVVLAWYP